MWNAAHAPGRIDRLALCSTSSNMPPRELWDERAATVREQGTDALADATMERWFSDEFRAEQPDTVAGIRAMVASTPPEGYAACCEAIREWDFRDRLGEISAPTLVLSAEDDPSTPPEHGRLIADGIPGARFVVLPAPTRHLANVEQPGGVHGRRCWRTCAQRTRSARPARPARRRLPARTAAACGGCWPRAGARCAR